MDIANLLKLGNEDFIASVDEVRSAKRTLNLAIDRMIDQALLLNSKEQLLLVNEEGLYQEVPGVPDLRINVSEKVVYWKKIRIEDLTRTEYKMLLALAKRPRIIRTRDEMLEELDMNYDMSERNIDSHIKRMRHKFRKYDPNFPLIHTVYGEGYCLLR